MKTAEKLSTTAVIAVGEDTVRKVELEESDLLVAMRRAGALAATRAVAGELLQWLGKERLVSLKRGRQVLMKERQMVSLPQVGPPERWSHRIDVE